MINLKIKLYSSTWVQRYTQFPKQSPGYQVIKISRKSRQSSLRDFQHKLICQIWDCHLIHGVETSSTAVSNPDFESQLVLQAKQGKDFNCQFTDCLEKHDFLQMTSNIDILYIVGKHFSSRVWIQDRCLKIRLYLAWINCQYLLFLHRKMCRWSVHFRHERRVPLWRGGQEELVGTLNRKWGCLEIVVQRQEATAWPCVLHALPPSWASLYRAAL